MPDGTTSHATYGADGEMTHDRRPGGRHAQLHIRRAGPDASSTDQLGRKTTFAYDAVGNLTSTTDPSGVTYDKHV